MSSPAQFIEDAVQSARRAVQFDTAGQYTAAAYYYKVSAQLLQKAAAVSDVEKGETLLRKSGEYAERARILEMKTSDELQVHEDVNKRNQKRCMFLLEQGLDADVAGAKDSAIQLYTNAIEFITQNPELLQGELKELALQALARAEVLKGINNETFSSKYVATTSAVPVRSIPSLHRGSSATLKIVPGKETYTEEEKRVLLRSSNINNKEYVPFMSIDLAEKFQYAFPFTDKDGHLALSPKQRREFCKWVRPEEISSEPCIILSDHPDYYSIKQTIVSDCSFVASLAVSASYEKRFGRRLVTSILYPRSRDKKPLYNPFGKYMVKLHLNGVSRKVIIDDMLPLNKHGKLLCSYSSNRNELWISLLEKAYMKVMGGYDFPGSNSNIDLHALTGWIPERVAIRPNDPDFNKDGLFTKLEQRMSKGDVLVTVATGDLSDAEAERTGLVSTHAYAVMDVRTVNGVRLLKLKNPWSHLRWRGNYSELDVTHWTSELRKTLSYDPDSAAQFDNGVFWIDYDSICRFYDVFYMNWNPELFKFTYCIHSLWSAGLGPSKDAYTIGSNPQFCLDVGNETGAVWILLTRHITQIEDFRENREFITVLVYKSNGRKIYYPNDPPPYIDGVRINSPHYLCKIIIGPDSSKRYTLVVSQYEKSQTIYYTLRAYATCPFSLNKISNIYSHNCEVSGEWKDSTAGGCGNHPTYRNNPRYRLTVKGSCNDSKLLIELKGPKQYQLGFDVSIVSVEDDSITAPFKTTSSGAFRSGYVVMDLENIPEGVLHIIPATFYPNQEGPFIITIKATAAVTITRDR